MAIASPRAVLKEAFSMGIIDDEDIWNKILQSRNLTSHIYDEETAIIIANQIVNEFIVAFKKLETFYAT